MTLTEVEACIGGLVHQIGFRHVMCVVIAAARAEAGQKATEAEREFAELQRIAEAAGLEKSDDEA